MLIGPLEFCQRAWRGLRRDEQSALLACGVALLFCAGDNYARLRAAQPLPSLFMDVPQGIAGKDGLRPTILVHVTGAVRVPGVYRLVSDARVADALRLAGGAITAEGRNALNLAARVEDGQQIRVPDIPFLAGRIVDYRQP